MVRFAIPRFHRLTPLLSSYLPRVYHFSLLPHPPGICKCSGNFAGSDCSVCKSGFSGSDCNTPISTNNESSNTGTIVGIIVGIVAVIAGTIEVVMPSSRTLTAIVLFGGYKFYQSRQRNSFDLVSDFDSVRSKEYSECVVCITDSCRPLVHQKL